LLFPDVAVGFSKLSEHALVEAMSEHLLQNIRRETKKPGALSDRAFI